MNYFPLTPSQLAMQARVADLAAKEIAPRAAGYDARAEYPRESLEALRDAGLWALRVSREHGGLEGDLLTTCLVVEEVAKKRPSTAMGYKMHLEASEVLNLLGTPYQVERFVKPLGRGEVFATIAGGESWGPTGTDWRGSTLEAARLPRVSGADSHDVFVDGTATVICIRYSDGQGPSHSPRTNEPDRALLIENWHVSVPAGPLPCLYNASNWPEPGLEHPVCTRT
jgi:alkylation response protein AidB-like acyl-CoA dehydrogenase